jgi:gamma-glutamyltranspeptidase/glutathione hydrolase
MNAMKFGRPPATHRLCSSLLIAVCAVSLPAWSAPVHGDKQMVVAANPHASDAGIGILRAGGSAVDAAIAVQLVLSMVEPQSSGIGGGAFMLVYDAPENGAAANVISYQGRETAPAAATADMFLDARGNERSFVEVGFGGLSVGVPGAMRMLELAHTEHGRLPWAQLFEPAIELAEQGFEITPRLYFLLDRFKNIASAQAFKAHYYDADGEAYATGYKLSNPEYAATLRLLAREGAKAMYNGPLAEAIVEVIADNNLNAGRMTLADLAGYRAQRLSALCTPYREWRVCGPQLPSSGGIAVQQSLAMLGHFELPAIQDDPIAAIHLVTEATSLAFADRDYYLGDPDFVDVPVAGLMSPAYIAARAALIKPAAAIEDVNHGEPAGATALNYAASPQSELKSTSHFSIVDAWGDAVSMTTSVQGAFGSQLMVGGFILNNQLTDFTGQPVRNGRPVANAAAAGKRPLSSMTPTIVLDDSGRPRLLIGSPGGTRIINFVTQAIVGVLDWGLDIEAAVAAPHFLSRGGPIELEERTDLLNYADGLRALGHEVVERNLNSGLHGIAIEYDDEGVQLWGGVDPRREGVALAD